MHLCTHITESFGCAHNLVNQLYFNTTLQKEKKKQHRTEEEELVEDT